MMVYLCHAHHNISTHAPRVRRDKDVHENIDIAFNFYSRASCEARPKQDRFLRCHQISTHAPRVRRDQLFQLCQDFPIISTHAPRVRRDFMYCARDADLDISTHAPRVRRDVNGIVIVK